LIALLCRALEIAGSIAFFGVQPPLQGLNEIDM
jgi:hypothetical protein